MHSVCNKSWSLFCGNLLKLNILQLKPTLWVTFKYIVMKMRVLYWIFWFLIHPHNNSDPMLDAIKHYSCSLMCTRVYRRREHCVWIWERTWSREQFPQTCCSRHNADTLWGYKWSTFLVYKNRVAEHYVLCSFKELDKAATKSAKSFA